MKIKKNISNDAILMILMLSFCSYCIKDLRSISEIQRRSARMFDKLRKIEKMKKEIKNGVFEESNSNHYNHFHSSFKGIFFNNQKFSYRNINQEQKHHHRKQYNPNHYSKHHHHHHHHHHFNSNSQIQNYNPRVSNLNYNQVSPKNLSRKLPLSLTSENSSSPSKNDIKNFIQNDIKSILISQLSKRSDDQKQLIYDSLIESNSPLSNFLLSQEKQTSKSQPLLSGLLSWKAKSMKQQPLTDTEKQNKNLYLGLMATAPKRDIFLKFLKSGKSPKEFLKTLDNKKNQRNLFLDSLGSMVSGVNPGVAVGGGLAAAGAAKGQDRQMRHAHEMRKIENETSATIFMTEIDDDAVRYLHKAQAGFGCLVERLRNIGKVFEATIQIRIDELFEKGFSRL